MKQLLVRDIMSPNIKAVRGEMTLEQLSRFFVEEKVGGAPVVNSGTCPLGVIGFPALYNGTRGELPKVFQGDSIYYHYSGELFWDLSQHEKWPPLGNWAEIQVAQAMTPLIYRVSENTSLPELADFMAKQKLQRALVTRDNRLVGEVNTQDILYAVSQSCK